MMSHCTPLKGDQQTIQDVEGTYTTLNFDTPAEPLRPRLRQESREVSSALEATMENWCEYVSRDGEVRNVLQFFCECEDLDETITNLVAPNATSTTSAPGGWKRVLGVAQDRARFPWPGGARRVDLAWLLAAALLWLVRLAARRSTTIVQVVLVVGTCFGVLGYSHLRALRQRSSSQFHVAWLSLSVLGLYIRHRGSVRSSHPPVLSRTADVILHFCLLVMVACYGHCCVADPGRIETTAATAPGEGALASLSSWTPISGQREGADSDAGAGAGLDSGAEDDAEPLLRERQQGQQQQQDEVRGHRHRHRQRQRQQRQDQLQQRGQQPSPLLRSGWCSICRCTFRLRDHHCVWVGQCVAEWNRRSFLAFLVLLAGLSLWFSSRTLALMVVGRRAPSCRGSGCDSFSAWAHASEVLRLPPRLGVDSATGTELGGEDVAVALYALVAGFLAAALAAQQAFLVSAGVTTAELRTRRSPRPPPSSPGDESSSSAGHPGTNGSRSSAVRGLSLARSPAAPAALPTSPPTAARSSTRRRSSSFSSSAGRLIGNWWRFLAGTELPPGTTGAPLPGRGAVAAERAAAVVVVSPFEGEGHTPEAVDVTAAAAAVEPAARPWRDRGKLS